ncbi:YopX family protein [Kurthia populi]|uniref:YopX family protein n=1 Tax=Kurthia populi TaxID=1562132 RepID=A0ABW5XX38_9BACL
MREIKFRGKKIDGDWYYGDLITETREFNRTCDKAYILPYWETLNGPIFVDKESVGQYTGLKDKNGREIFEGDIYHMGDPRITYTVVWHDTGLDGKQNGSSSYVGLSYWQDRIEVIDNVYENKNLLEEK